MTIEQKAKHHVRWMIRRDMPSVLDIERKSFSRLKEVWKNAVGFDDYEVSTLGRVRSKDRVRLTPHPRKSSVTHVRKLASSVLAPYSDKDGYKLVHLYCNGSRKTVRVHRLVLEAFVGPPGPDDVACHYPDFDVSNNRLGNLMWGSRSLNRQHASGKLDGDSHWNRKLSSLRADEIRRHVAKGAKQRDLAAKFGVSESCISAVVLGSRWVAASNKAFVRPVVPDEFLDTTECWTEEDFICCLRQRNNIGMVAETDDQVIGYMIYELHKDRLNIINFAVHPTFHRLGVGTAMLDKLKRKLSSERRNHLLLEVRETNLAAQMFFKSQGFMASDVLRRHYEQTREDAYRMIFRYAWQ